MKVYRVISALLFHRRGRNYQAKGFIWKDLIQNVIYSIFVTSFYTFIEVHRFKL